MTRWLPDPASLKRPAYRSLAVAMSHAIETGVFAPGDRLPTHRELAYDLGLSVQTVSRAYEELTRTGAISGEVGRGSFVLRGGQSGETRPPWHRIDSGETVVDCSMLTPVAGEIHAERFRAALAELAEDVPPDVLFSFRPRAALRRHVEVGVRWLKRCGVVTDRDNVLPTNGSTSAMTIALMTAASAGDLVLTEELGHHTLPMLTRSLGLRLAGLPVDDDGILPDAFEAACRASEVRLLFTVPNGLNPMARMVSEPRRRAICAIAERHDVTIVENDAGGPMAPDRPPPLAAIAPQRVLYFTGFSKCLLPGLRYGLLVVPERLASAAMNRHLVTNWMATALMAEIATRWVEDGTARILIDWQRRALVARNRVAAEALRGVPHSRTSHGLHVWMPLPSAWSEASFVDHARHQGVAVAPGSAFAIGDSVRERGVRVCLGAGSERDIAHGLSILARLARNEPEPALLTG